MDMTVRTPSEENAVALFNDWYGSCVEMLRSMDGRAAALPFPELRPPVEAEEATRFLRGLSCGLYRPVADQAGRKLIWRCNMMTLVSKNFLGVEVRTKNAAKIRAQSREPFAEEQWKITPQRREIIAHLGLTSDLVHEYFYPAEHLDVESRARSRAYPDRTVTASAYALDIVVFSDADHQIACIGCEVKADPLEMDWVIEDVQACGGAAKERHRRDKDHNNCFGLLAYQPEWFLGAAPGVWRAFRVEYDGSAKGSFRLHNMDDVPRGSPPAIGP
jgi:hypothetical protein